MACRAKWLRDVSEGSTFHIATDCGPENDIFTAVKWIGSHEDMEVLRNGEKIFSGRGSCLRGDLLVHVRE